MTTAEHRERERWEAMDAAFGAWRQGCVRRRHHAGLSRAAVARAAGIDGTTMARVENLDGSPRYWPESRTIVKVSWALGWTLDELVDVFADDGEGLFARILKMEGPGGLTGYEALVERYLG